jgi:hypothetical protein
VKEEHSQSDGATSNAAPSKHEFWDQILDKVNTDLAGKSNHEESNAAAAAAVSEIDKLMGELNAARDYLSAEAERIKRENARLKSLSDTALASVRIISDSLSKWRENGEEAA